jgi:hypothetical protein
MHRFTYSYSQSDQDNNLCFSFALVLRQLSHKDSSTSPTLNSTTPIIPLRNSNPHPPSIATEPQRSNTPTKFGSIILDPFPRARIPHRNRSVSPSARKSPVNRVEGQCIDRVNRTYFCNRILYAMGSEGVVLILGRGIESVVGYSSLYRRRYECYPATHKLAQDSPKNKRTSREKRIGLNFGGVGGTSVVGERTIPGLC